jgi:predicted LPLAT superfamily acyltransferase
MSTVTRLRIADDHPAFAGHFPDNPIVPGVVLLDEALSAIAAHFHVATAGATVLNAKFLSVVRPGEALELEFARGAGTRVRFTIKAAGREALAATLDLGAPAVRPAPAAPSVAAAPAGAAWARHAERGSRVLLQLMSWISMRLGRRVSRVVLHGIAVYFFLFAPSARRHSRAYLRRALGREPSARDRYRQIHTFATTIHDRVFLLNDRFDLFEVTIEGEEIMRAALQDGRGALLMGAHLGSFEVIRSLGHQQAGLDVAMAMFADNARKINAALSAINPNLKSDIIELGHVSAMLELTARLDGGAFVGVMADRSFAEEEFETVEFLGAPAGFPKGPMRLACMLGRQVYFMAGLYLGGNRYHVVFEPVADFSTTTHSERAAAMAAAIRRYAALVERRCRSAPYNWCNFFDFWTPRPSPVRPSAARTPAAGA